jgi:hypothetical protein
MTDVKETAPNRFHHNDLASRSLISMADKEVDQPRRTAIAEPTDQRSALIGMTG